MARVQLALNVTDIDAAVEFYEKAFGTPVAKRRPGYANLAIAEPPLKLILFENSEGATLNHLGVQVESATEVNEATTRFVDVGLTTYEEQGVECCYAKQDKVYITDPDGAAWEWYTVLDESATMSPGANRATPVACCPDATDGTDSTCCVG
jgi:catechol 2,3-dioxygenase-like lactoylglutathione lyase family enzyme